MLRNRYRGALEASLEARAMRRLLITVLVLVILVAATVLALPFAVPLSSYRGEIEREASAAAARSVRVAGPIRISFFPTFGVRAEAISLANVPAGTAPNLAAIDAVRVQIDPAGLLQGRFAVSRIILEHPQIHLEVDQEGHSNWSLGQAEAHVGNAPSSRVQLTDFEIEDGLVTYANAKTGAHRTIDHINATLSLPRTSPVLTLHGTVVSSGTEITFDANVQDRQRLAEDETVPLSLSLASKIFESNFDGTVTRDGDATGDVRLDSPSCRDFLALLGHPASAPGGLGKLSLRSHLAAHSHQIALSNTLLLLDDMTVKGDLTVDTTNDVPRIAGSLDVDQLNLNPYLATAKEEGDETSGWSAKPISLDLLKDANANLTVHAGSLRVRALRVGETRLTATLENRRLQATLNPIGLYGGQGSASLNVDATGPVPRFANRLTFSDIEVGPFLTDAIGVSKIEGIGTIKLDVTSGGKSADAIMHGLVGRGAIQFRNGQIRGVDLGLVARTVQRLLSGGATGDNATTSYADMGGTFTIARGVLANRDFHLTSPVIRMTGNGQIDLGNRTIDFRIEPKAVLIAQSSLGVAVPFHIKGSWTHLHYVPDLSGIVGGVLDNLKSGAAPLTGLFGGGNKGGQGKKEKSKGVGDTLKSIFGTQ